MTSYFQHCGMCNQQSLRSACAYAQSDQNLYLSFEYSMMFSYQINIIWSFKAKYEAAQVRLSLHLSKMPHCLKSHDTVLLMTYPLVGSATMAIGTTQSTFLPVFVSITR